MTGRLVLNWTSWDLVLLEPFTLGRQTHQKNWSPAVHNTPKRVSLACKGRLTVRAVLKLLPDSKSCSRLYIDSNTPIRRCKLIVTGSAANGTDAAAVQAALAAPEGACQECTSCDPPCPQEVGVWYSDTASFDVQGCAEVAALGPDDPYVGTCPGIGINVNSKLFLAALTLKQA